VSILVRPRVSSLSGQLHSSADARRSCFDCEVRRLLSKSTRCSLSSTKHRQCHRTDAVASHSRKCLIRGNDEMHSNEGLWGNISTSVLSVSVWLARRTATLNVRVRQGLPVLAPIWFIGTVFADFSELEKFYFIFLRKSLARSEIVSTPLSASSIVLYDLNSFLCKIPLKTFRRLKSSAHRCVETKSDGALRQTDHPRMLSH
jgi:hypothetical protein